MEIEILSLFQILPFFPLLHYKPKGAQVGLKAKMSLKTPLCFPEPQAGQDIAALLQE